MASSSCERSIYLALLLFPWVIEQGIGKVRREAVNGRYIWPVVVDLFGRLSGADHQGLACGFDDLGGGGRPDSTAPRHAHADPAPPTAAPDQPNRPPVQADDSAIVTHQD